MRHFLEPVRDARRNYNHVALGQMVSLTALDIRAQGLAGFGCLPADHASSGYESGVAVHDVNNIGLFVVHFDLASLFAVAARYREVRSGDQRPPFGERG